MIALFVSYAIIFSVFKKKKIFKNNATAASKKILELITRQYVGLVDGNAESLFCVEHNQVSGIIWLYFDAY